MKKIFTLVLTALFLTIGTAMADDISVTITTANSGVTSSYASKTFDLNGITFGYNQWTKNSASIQAKKSTTHSLYNQTAMPGRIKSIKFHQTGLIRAITVCGGDTAKPVNPIAAPDTAKTMVFVFADSTNYRYFSMTTPSFAVYMDTIVVTYEGGSTAKAPTMTEPTSFFFAPLDVVISNNEAGATVFYTTDGTTPTTKSASFTGETDTLHLSATTTVKAFAAIAGKDTSLVVSTKYTYKAPAALPFEFDGGKSAVDTTSCFMEEGLGSDYSASPKLKFDGTGDYLTLVIGEAAARVVYDIKGNSYSKSTFSVLESANGADFDTVKVYTALGDAQTDTIVPKEATRYIKFVYTNKSGGNVALGKFRVTALNPAADYVADPQFSLEEGGFYEAQSLTLSCETEGASVYYTLDGSEPNDTCTLYKEAIAINDSVVVKAIAVKGENKSKVVSKTYYIAKTYASLTELCKLTPTAAGVKVIVTLTDEVIDSIYVNKSGTRGGIYLTVGERAVEVYTGGAAPVPAEWVVGGKVSGTIKGEWKEFNKTWEVCPANWDDVTYTAPTALWNTEAETKAIKVIENGQMIIIKGGVRYNALGAKL